MIRPLFFSLDPEVAHLWAMRLLRAALAVPGAGRMAEWVFRVNDPRLNVRRFGIDFPNPVGLSAGFDKNAEYFNVTARLGFGFVEVGTVTAKPRAGNPKPRVFRLPADRALVNRMDLNSQGAAAVVENLTKRRHRCIVGANIGQSPAVPQATAIDGYLKTFELLYDYVSYFTLDVSCPNSPGMMALQEREALSGLLGSVIQRNQELAEARSTEARPLLVKVSPDLEEEALDSIVEVCSRLEISGIIATNTTVARKGLRTPRARVEAIGAGGLSGAPLTLRSRQVVAHVFRRSGGKIPIVGVGGIMSGEDAWEMIRAGASLLQIYTGFIYSGPGFVSSINRHLLRRLEETGKSSLEEAVGEGALEGQGSAEE